MLEMMEETLGKQETVVREKERAKKMQE